MAELGALPGDAPLVSEKPELEALRLRGLIRRVYERHAPAKIASLEVLLDRYRGSEAEVYMRACRLYGERPISALGIAARAADVTDFAATVAPAAADAGGGADAIPGAMR